MWKCADYSEKFFDSMVEMIRDNYGDEQSISHKEYLKHWYFGNPIGSPIVKFAIDEDNGVMAGQYVISPREYKVFDERINCVLSLDTLTRESYRGQGIFTKLAKSAFDSAAKAGYKFCYGAPNPNSHPGFIKKLGFSDLFEMPLYVRPLKISQILKERGKKVLGTLMVPFNLFFMPKRIVDANIVEINDSNYQIMNVFWEKVVNKYGIIGIRDAKYIKYRYLNVPTREYHPYVYLVNNEPVAFIVSRVRYVAKMKTGMIADFLFVDGFEKQAKKLVRFMNRKIKELGAGLAGCIMMTHSSETKVLKRARYIKCPDKLLPQPTPLIIRIFDKNLEEKGILDTKNWFFTTGDYDVV